jgi:hypothetical protein
MIVIFFKEILSLFSAGLAYETFILDFKVSPLHPITNEAADLNLIVSRKDSQVIQWHAN